MFNTIGSPRWRNCWAFYYICFIWFLFDWFMMSQKSIDPRSINQPAPLSARFEVATFPDFNPAKLRSVLWGAAETHWEFRRKLATLLFWKTWPEVAILLAARCLQTSALITKWRVKSGWLSGCCCSPVETLRGSWSWILGILFSLFLLLRGTPADCPRLLEQIVFGN